ncbi:MAG: YcxB family protein [Flavobacterium sp.]
MYRVKETKRWFLIYTQHNSALPIFKSQLQPNQIEAIRTLLKTVPVKKQLL